MRSEEHWDIPDEYLTEIGRVTVRWSRLETYLIKPSGRSLLDPRSHVVFVHMGFPQKMHALSALVTECLKAPLYSYLSEYRKGVAPLLEEASRRRNEIIHQKWGVDEGVVGKSNISARGELKMQRSNVSILDIESASASIVKAADALMALVSAGTPESDAPQSGQ